MSSATGSIGLNNVGNILYLSNNITTLSSNLTIGTSPVTNEQFYFLGNANITGNLIGFSNVLIPNGNLGIGTANPLYRLDVAGAANISGNLNFSGNLLQNGSPYIGSQWTTNGGNISYFGNVGINTSSPIYALDISGDANIGSNVYGNNFFIRNDCLVQAGNLSLLNGNLNVSRNFNVFGETVLSGNLSVYNSDIYNYGNIYTYNGLYINKNGALYYNNENFNQHAFYAYDTINVMTALFGGADDTNRVGYIGVGGYGNSLPLILNPTGGNVGINNGNPQYSLDVAGSANISGNLNFSGNLLQNGAPYIGSQWTTSGPNIYYNVANGNVGIRTITPQFELDVNGNINFSGNLYQNGNIFSGGGGGQWITGNGTGNIYYMGNVGINNPSPIYAFDVAGDANIGANVYGNNFYIRNDCVLQAGDFSILNGNLTVYERFNAFGETELTGNLTVYNADIYNYGNIYTYNGLYINKNGALYNQNENPNQHAFYAYDTVNFMTTIYGGADDTNQVGYIGVGGYGGGLPLLLNPNGGNIGIGKIPSTQLDLSTDSARKLTTSTWATGSDERIKTNIVNADLERCYEIVSNIPLKYYTWINDISIKVNDKNQLGWIAQDVEKHFPKAITKSEGYGLNDLRILNSDQMTKVMYGALQKVIILNNDLANTVAQQKLQIQYLYQTLLPNLYISNIDIPNVNISNVIIPTTTILEPSIINSGNSIKTNVWGNISSKWDNLDWWN